jgi:hypothetical protein
MSWTVPGQGYFIEASYINSKYKFKEEGRGNPQRFEGIGNAKGVSVEWNKNNKTVIHVRGTGGEDTPVVKAVVQDVIKHFAGERIIQQNGKIVSKGRSDKNFTDYRPGWRGTWSPGYQGDWKERQKTLGFK